MSSQNTLYNKEEINSALEVIVKVMKLDAAQPFNTPVDPVALGIPDYSEVIDNPMDFGAIRIDLKNGVKYKNSIDVLNDMQYAWDNCSKYYTKGHYLLELMKRLKKKFTKYWIEAGLSMEQPQKMDERASSQPMKETLRENTNWQYGSVDPSQCQNQIISSQPQPHQYPHNYYMFYPPMQRPQYNMSSYNYPSPIPHGDKNSGFSGKDYSHSQFGPGSQGGQFLWRNNPIGSQLRQHRPSFGNARPYNPHLGWHPRPESAERPYPYEQGDTDLPMFDHPTHMHKNRPSVHIPYLPVPSSPKAPSQPQHKSFQSQPLLISDDETDLSISDNHSEDQLWSSHVVHPDPSSYHGVPPHHPDYISVLGSKAYSGPNKGEVPPKNSRPQLKFSKVQLGSNTDASFEEREAPHKRLKESNFCAQVPRQQEPAQTFNVIAQILGQDKNKYMQALDCPSRTRPESVEMDYAYNAEIKEMKGKMASMEQTCAQVATQIANIMSTISDMQKKLSDKDGVPPVPSQAATVSNDSGRPSASGVIIIRDIFSRVHPKK